MPHINPTALTQRIATRSNMFPFYARPLPQARLYRAPKARESLARMDRGVRKCTKTEGLCRRESLACAKGESGGDGEFARGRGNPPVRAGAIATICNRRSRKYAGGARASGAYCIQRFGASRRGMATTCTASRQTMSPGAADVTAAMGMSARSSSARSA